MLQSGCLRRCPRQLRSLAEVLGTRGAMERQEQRPITSTFSSPYSKDGEEGSTSSSFLPAWMKARLPGMLGGAREEIQEMNNLDMASYLQQLKMARRLGSMTGNAFGTSNASDPGTQGFLLMSEKVIERMTEEERNDPSDDTCFPITRKQEIAQDIGCSVEQVDDCIARYMWTKHMMSTLADYRKKGNAMPTTMEELERVTGRWTDFKQQHTKGVGSRSSLGSSSSSLNSICISADARSPKGGPCGLAGMTVGRSTKCPRMRKSYKACCGRSK